MAHRRLLSLVGWCPAVFPLQARGVVTEAADKIRLQGLVFHGYHGVLKEERVLGQKFVINATLTTDTSKAGRTDDLNDTVSYAAVYSDIKHIVEGEPCQLIETVAERIASAILQRYQAIHAISVRVDKPHVAVEGVVGALGIEIYRKR